jgi:hypothetical protein
VSFAQIGTSSSLVNIDRGTGGAPQRTNIHRILALNDVAEVGMVYLIRFTNPYPAVCHIVNAYLLGRMYLEFESFGPPKTPVAADLLMPGYPAINRKQEADYSAVNVYFDSQLNLRRVSLNQPQVSRQSLVGT